MFTIVEWDSGLELLLEFLFAVVVFVALFIIVRRVEKKSRRPDEMPPKNLDDA